MVSVNLSWALLTRFIKSSKIASLQAWFSYAG